MKRIGIINLFAFVTGVFHYTNISGQAGVGPAPYCMPLYSNIPCNQPNPSNNASNTINDFIDNFSTTGATSNITDNNTGCQTQVLSSVQQNYFFSACANNRYLRVVPGQVITCNFQSGIIFDQGFAVFIDWNQNNVFNMPGEQVCATPGVPLAATPASAVFTVPAAQPNGTYRLRVRCAYATNGVSIDPCLNYSFGETQDYYLIIGGNCSVLPIELISYEGIFNNHEISLNWKTAMEKNSDYFTIEKSYDNENFVLISKIVAAENSYTTTSYSVTDKNINPNRMVYYRLKQFDKYKSEESISRTITVYANERNLGFDLFPNPASTEMKLVLPDVLSGKTLTIGIYDNNGREVQKSETILTNYNTTQNININELEKGTYFVKIFDNSGDVVMKKILLKQ